MKVTASKDSWLWLHESKDLREIHSPADASSHAKGRGFTINGHENHELRLLDNFSAKPIQFVAKKLSSASCLWIHW